MKGCKHEWENVAESNYSDNEWCAQCGAWKRFDKDKQTTKIYHPRLAQVQS